MTEPDTPRQPGGAETPDTPAAEDSARPGPVRTPGETSVDDALGQGDPAEG